MTLLTLRDGACLGLYFPLILFTFFQTDEESALLFKEETYDFQDVVFASLKILFVIPRNLLRRIFVGQDLSRFLENQDHRGVIQFFFYVLDPS